MFKFGGLFSNGVDYLQKHGDSLIRKVEKKTYNSAHADDPHGVIKAYLVRLQNNVEAMVVLLKDGYGNPAIILQRSLIEDYLNLSYILKHPNISRGYLIKQFYEYLTNVQRHKHMERYEKMGTRIEEPLRSEIINNFQKFKNDYNDGKGVKRWSCMSLESQAKELSNSLNDDTYIKIYYTMYNLFSEEYHSLSRTFLEHVNTSLTLKSASGRADYRTEETMINIIIKYGELIQEIAKFYGISNREFKNVAEKLLKKLRKQFDIHG
ncbi:DUF5677 domain-containing protein [Priestia megaterium]|uniref:DUF5677 domain-containing protein n=2 Tax=Priestia megaterium TaxID=1404 RepID=UPI003CFFBB59